MSQTTTTSNNTAYVAELEAKIAELEWKLEDASRTYTTYLETGKTDLAKMIETFAAGFRNAIKIYTMKRNLVLSRMPM